jgi:predicted ATP-binding protein involved in virulence
MTELDFEYLRDVLDNITYWETCPETYRQRFKTLIKQIDEHRKELKNNVALGNVSQQRELFHKLLQHISDEGELTGCRTHDQIIDDFYKFM